MDTEDLSNMKVLIVDDGNLNLSRLKRAIIKEHGEMDIITARSCSEAEALFDTMKPEIVILDIALPDGSGISLLRKFREKSKSVKIIIWTSYASSEFRSSCLDLGADSFFEKSHIHRMINHIYNTKQGISLN